MSKFRFFLGLSVLLVGIAWGQDSASGERHLSLSQCFDLARNNSETLAQQRETIAQSRARARASLGGVFPRVAWQWRQTRQDSKGVGDTFGGMLDKTQVDSRVEFQQPLYNGFKEFSAWSGFKRQEARDAWTLRQSELDLYADVAQTYFDVLSLEADLANTQTTLHLAQEQVTELTGFVKLGKSREAEVFTAQSDVAALNAGRVRLQGRIRIAREQLSFLIGQPVSIEPLMMKTPPAIEPVAHFLERVARRPDISALREEVSGQTLRVRYERAALWPSLNLAGNYYTHRPSPFEPVDWDATLSLGVPLFQGGSVDARVDEAKSVLTQTRQALGQRERQAFSDVRRAYLAWESSREEKESLEAAFRAAEKSYLAQKNEYRLGLVTNLEVLTSLHAMQNARRSWDETTVETARRYVALLLTTGDRP